MLRSTAQTQNAVAPVATPSPGAPGTSSTPVAGTVAQSTARPAGAPGKAPKLPVAADLTRTTGKSAKSKASALAKGIREGRSTYMPSFGPLTVVKANQKPNTPGQQIIEPRFDGPGTFHHTADEQDKVVDEVRQSVDTVGQSRSARQGNANKVKRFAQNVLTLGGCSKGAATLRPDVMNLAERTRIGANTETENGPTPDLQPLHTYIDTRADVEVVDVAIRFAEAGATGDQKTLSDVNKIKNELADKHDEAAGKMLEAAVEQRAAVLRSLQAGDMKIIHEAMNKVFPRLDKNGIAVGQNGIRLPDVLASKTLAEAALRLFRDKPDQMSKALEGLSNATCEGLVKGIAKALEDTGAINADVGIVDPLTRLAVEIGGLEGGCKLLAEAMASTEPKGVEALRVALLAASTMQHEMRLPNNIDLAQQNFLQAAVRHSGRVIADEAGDSSKDERIAYRAVQNGIMSRGSGSPFERISQKLDAFTGRKLPDTAKRNARAASGRTGRAINWVSSVAGERTFWRKSNLRGVTADLGSNSMLPTRAEVIATLDITASDARLIIAERLKKAEGDPALLMRMMESVLDAVSLGKGKIDRDSPLPEDPLKHLDRSFFESVESAMGPETMKCLPVAVKDAWDAMKETHPNVAHVLLLINEHLSLRDDIEAACKPGASLIQIGARSDRLMLAAMEDFEGVAKRAQTVAKGEMADLAVAVHEALVGIQSSAARLALRIDVLETVEFKLARELSQREGKTMSVDDVMATWPEELREKWVEIKSQSPDAGRLMRLVFDHIPGVASSAGDTNDVVTKAAASLARLQDDVHINRYEVAVADAVTTFNDVRCGRDAMGLMRSLTHRFSLGEKVRAAHAREVGVNVGRGISFVTSHGPLGMFSPILGLAHSYDDFVEMSMNGATMQMFIGNTESTLFFGGFAAGFRGMLGMDDHELNPHMDKVGVGARLDARWEGAREWALADALVLRVPRVTQQEDQMRREVGDILRDLVREDFDGQRLEALLDGHERLSVGPVKFEKKTNMAESSVGTAWIFRRGKKESREQHDATGYGAQTYLSAKSQNQTYTQTEKGGALQIEEFKLSQQQRTEARFAVRMPESLLPSKDQRGGFGMWAPDTKANPQVKIAGYEVRKQLMNSGLESTVRLVTHKGATWAQQTQQIREFESFEDFLEEFGPRQHQYLTFLANQDPVPGATVHEKLARAHQRLKKVFEQAEREAGPNMVVTMVTRLRDEMGPTYDMLSALATLAERDAEDAMRRGNHDEAEDALARVANHRRDVQALLLNDSAWTALNIQIKSKAKTETAKSPALGFFSAKTASETTSLQSFLPLAKHRVGRVPSIPSVIPGANSPLWSATRLTRGSSMYAASGRAIQLADLNLSGELSAELSGDLSMEVTTPLLRPFAGEQSGTQARANRKAELQKKLDEHTVRDAEIRSRGTTPSKVSEKWLAVMDKMPAFDEIRRLPLPLGLDQAPLDPNVVGWMTATNNGTLSDKLDQACKDGIDEVKRQLWKLKKTYNDAKQKVEELYKPISDSKASPRQLETQIALNVMEAESVAFAAATEVDKAFDYLVETATKLVTTLIDSSETLPVVYRAAFDAAQQAIALNAAVTRAQDTVDWLNQQKEVLGQSRDTTANDWQEAYMEKQLKDAEMALEAAKAAKAADVNGAMPNAQRLAREAKQSFVAVGDAYDAAQKISELVDLDGALEHDQVQVLLNAANERSKEVVGLIEAAVQSSRSTSSLAGSLRRSTPDIVSDQEPSSPGSGSISPPAEEGVVSEPEASDENRHAEALRRAQATLAELRIDIAQSASTSNAGEHHGQIVAEAEAEVKAVAAKADLAEQHGAELETNPERLSEDWSEIRPASPQANVAGKVADPAADKIDTSDVATEHPRSIQEQLAETRQFLAVVRRSAERASTVNDEAWKAQAKLREEIIALRQKINFGVDPDPSIDVKGISDEILVLNEKLGVATSHAKATRVVEVNTEQRLKALQAQEKQLLELLEAQPKKPKGLKKLLRKFTTR